MEEIYVPTFITGMDTNSVLSGLKMFSAMVDSLAAERKRGIDVTVPIMKTLAYINPLPGVPDLNIMFDILKDLVFHKHLMSSGKTKKTASLGFSKAKNEIFPQDHSENWRKILNLQGLLKKEHKKCVNMFEEFALKLYQLDCEIVESEIKMREFRRLPVEDRTDKDDAKFHFHYTRARINRDVNIPEVYKKTKLVFERELVLRDQLKLLSMQLSSMIEKQIRKVVRTSKDQLLKVAKETEIFRETVEIIQGIKPGTLAHQIYTEASDICAFPSKPQKLVYCPDCSSYVIRGVENEQMYHFINTAGKNTSNNASAEINTNWHADMYMKAEVKFKALTDRELKLARGDKVKSKLLSSDKAWAFGWKKTLIGTKKVFGFFPTAVVTRTDEGDVSQPLLD